MPGVVQQRFLPRRFRLIPTTVSAEHRLIVGIPFFTLAQKSGVGLLHVCRYEGTRREIFAETRGRLKDPLDGSILKPVVILPEAFVALPGKVSRAQPPEFP